MRRILVAVLLASALPVAAFADDGDDVAEEREETPEQKKARLESERDAARIKALNYGLPWHTQEAADKQKEIDELDGKQTASDDAGAPSED